MLHTRHKTLANGGSAALYQFARLVAHFRRRSCPTPRPPTIAENTDDLRRRLHAERDPERKRRLHALTLFASGEATTRVEVARPLAVDRQTVACWLDCYRDGGLDAS